MTRTKFFKHFELLADQQDAVAKMRGLVLELAIRGQLVERNAKDEPAAKLLEKIRTAKREFLRANKFKETEALPQICAAETPFKCPSAWEWVRLGSISNRIHYGYTASADHSQKDVRLLRITDIQNNQVNWETVPGCQISAHEVAKYALHDNDILIARTGGTIGKTFLVANVAVKAVFASYLIRVIPSSQISAQYLKLFLESRCYWQQLLAKSVGTGQPNVNGEALSSLCVSLPPLAEQRRIVAKVDELMALCDELEQRQQARQHARGQLQQSALHHLLAAREPQTFAAAWQRVRDHFHLLHDTPDAIPQLRQAILQLAVQGRLSAKDQPLKELSLGELLAEPSVNGVSKAPSQNSGGVEILRISAGTSRRDFFVNEDDFKHVQLTDHEVKKFRLRANDLLACRFNGNLRYVGRFSLYRALSGRTQVNSDKLIRFRVDESRFLPRFVCYAMNAQPTRIKIEALCATTAGNIGISASELKEVSIPIPPLAEQKRIVARVEELLRWCDTLEAQLHQTRTLGAHLLDSTLHRLLAA